MTLHLAVVVFCPLAALAIHVVQGSAASAEATPGVRPTWAASRSSTSGK